MSREFLIGLGLFLTPFGLYALYLGLTRSDAASARQTRPWSASTLTGLTIAGLILSLVLFGLVAGNAGRQLFGRNPEAEAVRTR